MLVFVDTNVWFPISVADLILRSVEAGIFDLAWSDESLSELERILVAVKKLEPDKARLFIWQIKSTAPYGRIDPQDYMSLMDGMVGPDQDDHIFSAAVQGGKIDILLTENLTDFPQVDIGPNAISRRPDDFFVGLLQSFPEEFLVLIEQMSANLKRPPLTEGEVLARLAKCGLPEFEKQMRGLVV